MISVIAAPETAPQVYTPPPAPPSQPRLDRLEQRLLEIVRDEGTTQIWWLLNKIGDEEAPGDRSAARTVRVSLWHRLKRLLWHGLLWKHGRTAVGIRPPSPQPTSPRQAQSSQRPGRRKHRATVRPSLGADVVSTAGCENPDGMETSAGQFDFQLVGQNFPDTAATEAVPQSKCVPTRYEVSTAARQLSTLPRGRKKMSGWLNNRERIWRDRKILVDGQPAFAYGALRGQVVYFLDLPRQMERGRWGLAPVNRVRLWRNPAAQLLGGLKRGIREQPSVKKQITCRINGCKPCRKGKRGRPRGLYLPGLR